MKEPPTKDHWDRSHIPDLRASSGIEASTCKLEANGESSSGSGFFKRSCPFWWGKKRAAKSPQEEAASKSRLCVEAAHESPIPAVRKPAPRQEALGLDPGEESAGAKPGCSLLRTLLCPKAASSRPEKPPRGPEASPLCRASTRCGPVAALSRTADPQGESPLRWKPRAENQSQAEETSGGAEVAAAADPSVKPEGSWTTQPWRAFKTAVASRVKKRSVLPGSHLRATADGDLYTPAGPETSSFTKTDPVFGEALSNAAATEEQKPSGAFPDNAHSHIQKKGSQRISWHGLEIHRTVEDDAAGSDMATKVGKSISLILEGSPFEQSPAHPYLSEWERLQKQVYYNLPGGNGADVPAETAMEDEDLEGGGCGYWAEEEEDLADLAENPGGQGMLMATRDLGWLSSKLLGDPKSWKTDQKVEGEIPQTQESGKGKPAAMGPNKEVKAATVPAADMTQMESFFLPPPASGSDESHLGWSTHCHISGAYIPKEEGALFPQKGEPPSPLGFPPSSFSTGGSEWDLQSPPPSKPHEAVAVAEGGEGQQEQPSPPRKLPPSTQEATAWMDGTGSEPERDEHLIYVAAVEIVGAAIDAAAVQLAKKDGEEQAELGDRVP